MQHFSRILIQSQRHYPNKKHLLHWKSKPVSCVRVMLLTKTAIYSVVNKCSQECSPITKHFLSSLQSVAFVSDHFQPKVGTWFKITVVPMCEMIADKTTPKRSTYEHKKHKCFHLKSSWSKSNLFYITSGCVCQILLPQQEALTDLKYKSMLRLGQYQWLSAFERREIFLKNSLRKCTWAWTSTLPQQKALTALKSQVSAFARVLWMTNGHLVGLKYISFCCY